MPQSVEERNNVVMMRKKNINCYGLEKKNNIVMVWKQCCYGLKKKTILLWFGKKNNIVMV